jgi:hypothetical protein
LDELKLVVWGEERVENKAETIADQNHHNIKTKLQSEEPPPVRRWYITDEEPVNTVRMQWIDHENKPVSIASEVTEADLAPYTRAPGQPGGVGGYGGPHAETGFAFFQDAFRFDSVAFTPAGADGLKTITCNMTSNVSQVPTNGLDNTNAFVLKQLSSDSLAYAAENGVLGFWPTSDPGGAPGQRRTFSAMVVNPVFGFNGSKMFYETAIGSDTYQTRRVQLVAALDSLPDGNTIQTVTATLTSDVPGANGALTTGAVSLSETAADSNEFASADNQFKIKIDRVTNNGTAAVNDFTATVNCAALDVTGQPIDAIESGLGTLEFRTDLLHNQGQPILQGNAFAAIGGVYRVRIADTKLWDNQPAEIIFSANPQKYGCKLKYGIMHYDNLEFYRFIENANRRMVSWMGPPVETSNLIYVMPGDAIIAQLEKYPSIRTTITVVKADLAIIKPDMSELPESVEETEGEVVQINIDDDNDNGLSDKADWGIMEENDLLPIKLHKLAPAGLTGLAYKLHFNSNCFAIWKKPDMTDIVQSDITPFPVDADTTVYIEGLVPSKDINGDLITLQLYKDGKAINGDTVKVIVPQMMFALFGDGGTGEGPLRTYLNGAKKDQRTNPYIVKTATACFSVFIWKTQKLASIAFNAENGYVVYDGHSNFGLGPTFTTGNKSLSDFMNTGSAFAAIELRYLREYQGHPDLTVKDSEIAAAPRNYVTALGIERFPNNEGVGVEHEFTLKGYGIDRFHYDESKLIVNAGKGDLPALHYKAFFFNSCNSGQYFADAFQHGVFFYTKIQCYKIDTTCAFIKACVDGKSWNEVLLDLNNVERVNAFKNFGN